MFRTAVIVLWLCTFCWSSAQASGFAYLNRQKSPAISKVFIEVDDQVTDGCWTNKDAVRNAVAVFFTQSGFTVQKESWDVMLSVRAIGYRLQNTTTCIGTVSINLETGVAVNGEVIFYNIFFDQYIASTGRGSLDRQFITWVRESLDRLYLNLQEDDLLPR